MQSCSVLRLSNIRQDALGKTLSCAIHTNHQVNATMMVVPSITAICALSALYIRANGIFELSSVSLTTSILLHLIGGDLRDLTPHKFLGDTPPPPG